MLWTLDDDRRSRVAALRVLRNGRAAGMGRDRHLRGHRQDRSRNSTTHAWNHSLGEIITALLENGMTLTALTEHDSVPWNAIPGQMTLDEQTGEWRIARRSAAAGGELHDPGGETLGETGSWRR